MNWIQHYKLRSYLRNSVWLLSVFGMLAALGSVRVLHWLEQRAGWQLAFDPDAARALLGSLDPTFAFRIIVDIASKGLSPAINDPTTAVLAIDQLHDLLRAVGERHLDEGVVRDPSGSLRLVYPTPDWEDFVYLAVTEIRHFGGTSIQVARRLRAMLENLIEVLPPERTALLGRELTLLHRSAGRSFPEPEDQALAEVSDLQGVGGKHSLGKVLAREPASAQIAEPKRSAVVKLGHFEIRKRKKGSSPNGA